MKFALKICLCTVLIVALLFGIAGQILIAQSFEAALKFRVRMSVAEFSALASAMEAEIYGIQLYHTVVSEQMYEEILARASRNQGTEAPCALYDTDQNLIASAGGTFPEQLPFSELRPRRFAYTLLKDGDSTMLNTAGSVVIGGNNYFLMVRYHADDLMQLRREQIRSVVIVHIITVAVCTAVMLLVAYFLSKPLIRLKRFTSVIVLPGALALRALSMRFVTSVSSRSFSYRMICCSISY